MQHAVRCLVSQVDGQLRASERIHSARACTLYVQGPPVHDTRKMGFSEFAVSWLIAKKHDVHRLARAGQPQRVRQLRLDIAELIEQIRVFFEGKLSPNDERLRGVQAND